MLATYKVNAGMPSSFKHYKTLQEKLKEYSPKTNIFVDEYKFKYSIDNHNQYSKICNPRSTLLYNYILVKYLRANIIAPADTVYVAVWYNNISQAGLKVTPIFFPQQN